MFSSQPIYATDLNFRYTQNKLARRWNRTNRRGRDEFETTNVVWKIVKKN
jgi:hypothetical protein